MAFKIILDTNIILDLTLERTHDYADLRKIYARITGGYLKCYTTTSIIQTSAYWLVKERGVLQTKKIILAILNDITVIEASHNIVVDAMYSTMDDIEDAMQYYTAVHHKLDAFISRDKDFIKSAISKLPVYHPEDFIRKFI